MLFPQLTDNDIEKLLTDLFGASSTTCHRCVCCVRAVVYGGLSIKFETNSTLCASYKLSTNGQAERYPRKRDREKEKTTASAACLIEYVISYELFPNVAN